MALLSVLINLVRRFYQWKCSIMISIPETRKSSDPGVKYTMPMWIQKDVSVGEWHKTCYWTELLLVRIVRGPGQKGQKGWGQLWVLGGSAPVPRKETSMKAGPYLCLTQPAERLCVMRVQLKKDRLSLCPDGLFLFISKVWMIFFQIIYKRYVSVIANNYLHSQIITYLILKTLKSFLVKSLIPKISPSERTQNVLGCRL